MPTSGGQEKCPNPQSINGKNSFSQRGGESGNTFLMNLNPVGLLFLIVASLALLVVPRRWALVPLLVSACYMTIGQGTEIIGFNFQFIRLVLLAGIVRVFVRRERPRGLMLSMDWAFVAWGGWMILSSAFHKNPAATLQFHLGLVYNGLGFYFLIRCLCQTEEEIRKTLQVTGWLLVPVALAMLYEQASLHNIFSVFGGVPDVPMIREGLARAQGPFAHPVLAGTVGGVCIPLMIVIWRSHPVSARIGVAACLGMVVASGSSGPWFSVISGLFALVVWRWRHWTREMRIAAVVGYLLLELVMNDPAYYIITRVKLIGSSTAYHRAALIEAGLTHFKEWWFAGTDYTRHWMPTGVSWSPDQADITNYYLGQGVKGGLLLMLLFICILWIGFRYVGQIQRLWSNEPAKRRFLVWSLGASLFAHVASCLGVGYFDQSVLFLYLTLALIANIRAKAASEVLPTKASAQEVSHLSAGSPTAAPAGISHQHVDGEAVSDSSQEN